MATDSEEGVAVWFSVWEGGKKLPVGGAATAPHSDPGGATERKITIGGWCEKVAITTGECHSGELFLGTSLPPSYQLINYEDYSSI